MTRTPSHLSSSEHSTSKDRPLIIPVFIPHGGCPHQCVFCDQKVITSEKHKIPSSADLRSRVSKFLTYTTRKKAVIQIAFYGGNFLGLHQTEITRLLNTATEFVSGGLADSIRFSTRPDTVDPKRLELLTAYPVKTIELGVQSMDDDVLAMTRRGHTSAHTKKACAYLKERHYEIGLQMMFGLPGDDETRTLETGRRIADLCPDFVRIYPTVVLANSPLAQWYQEGKYMPLSLEASIDLAKKLYLQFKERKIRVARMGLQASEDLNNGAGVLAGPYHPAFGHLVLSRIFLDTATVILESRTEMPAKIMIKIHPRSVSKMLGQKRQNIEILKKKFFVQSIQITPDPSLAEDQLKIDGIE
ncbi:elongator complex protein 3 [Thermodesulfobacteriota bacterium]